MSERLLPSGRVRYFPMCEYAGNRRFVSRLSGDEYEVKVRRKEVDGRYLEPSIPATYPPPFDVSPEARCLPPNDLPRVSERADGYVIIGAGKTAADTCLWLLANGVPPDDIRWIKPREIAFLNRTYTQGGELVGSLYEGFSLQLEAAAQATTIDDLFARLSAAGQLLRASPRPCTAATVSAAEADRSWSQEPDIANWLERARLNISRGLKERSEDRKVQQARKRLKANVLPGLQNLLQILARSSG